MVRSHFLLASHILLLNKRWVSASIFVSEYATKQSNGLAQSCIAMSLLALSINLIVAPIICQMFGLLKNQFIEFLLVNLSTLLIYLLYQIDSDFNNKIAQSKEKGEAAGLLGNNLPQNSQAAHEEKIANIKVVTKTGNTPKAEEEPAKDYQSQFDKLKTDPSQKKGVIAENCQKAKNFPLVYWHYYLSNSLSIVCTQGIDIIGPVFLTTYMHYAPLRAGFICSLNPLTSLVAPLMGITIDKIGNLTLINIIAVFLHFFPVLMLPYFPYPEVTFLLFGVGNTIRISTQLPVLNLVIPKNTQGLGFALIKVFKGLSGFLVVLINGWIASRYGYLPVVWINAVIGMVAFVYGYFTHQEYKRLCTEQPKYIFWLEKQNNPDLVNVK